MSNVGVPLTLQSSVGNIIDYTTWNSSDGAGDPYVGYTYQWQVDISVNAQFTGEWQNNFAFTENDVQIGDWVIQTSNVPEVALQIIDIINVGNGVITCIIEDVDRYNLQLTGSLGINPASGSGVYDALIIRLGEDGLPIFSNIVPGSIPVTTETQITSRFLFRNYLQNNYRTYQIGNTFVVGDEISLNANGTYSLASAVGSSAYGVIGRIKDINIPGTGWFTYEPKGKLVRYISPNLPGYSGSVVYLDPNNPGKLTTNKSNSGIAIPLFIKINNSTGVKLDEVLLGGLDNFTASVAPTVTDDSSLGYSYGSLWIDTVHQKSYINVNPTVGISNWQLIGSATATVATTTSLGSVQIGDNINVNSSGVISVTKGAGINKVIDIPDVNAYNLGDGDLLSYNATSDRWDVGKLGAVAIDGGEF